MNKKNFLTMAVVTAIALSLAMTSCSKTDEEVNENSKVELRLSSGVKAQLRASFPDTDKQIPEGEKVVVYVDETGGEVKLYENNVLTAKGDGTLTGGTPMYFPAIGKNVDIYAFHTNPILTGSYPTTVTHEVESDQSTLAGYAPSDLLYARSTNVARTTGVVELTFYHLLSKLQVAVKAGNGLEDSDIKGITIGGTKLQAEFTLDKITSAPNNIEITAAGSVTPIKIGADVSKNFTDEIEYNDAIIVPQTLASGTTFITVHLSGTDLFYRLPSEITFESKKIYKYQLTANLTGLTLTTEIADWVPVGSGPVEGDATPDNEE